MPIKNAAKKDMRKNARRFVRNLRDKRELHESTLEIQTLVKAGKKDEAKKAFVGYQTKLDKAAKAWLDKKTADRKKSRVMAMINKTTDPAPAKAKATKKKK